MRIFSRLKFPTDHHTVPCQCVTITTTHHMLSRTHWRPHATSSPGRFSLASEMGPRDTTSKASEKRLGDEVGGRTQPRPQGACPWIKAPWDEVGLHGPHQSKYTKTGRPRIQRYVRQLIWAPDVNDFGQTKKSKLTWLHFFLMLASLFGASEWSEFLWR